MEKRFGNLDDCEFPHRDKARPIITWQQILTEFDGVSSAAYFLGVLKVALEKYEKLRGRGVKINDAWRSGDEIVAGVLRGGFEFEMMGRVGGIHGLKLHEDIASGEWRTQPYEVKKTTDEPLNSNWFPIAKFVEMVPHPNHVSHMSSTRRPSEASSPDE